MHYKICEHFYLETYLPPVISLPGDFPPVIFPRSLNYMWIRKAINVDKLSQNSQTLAHFFRGKSPGGNYRGESPREITGERLPGEFTGEITGRKLPGGNHRGEITGGRLPGEFTGGESPGAITCFRRDRPIHNAFLSESQTICYKML